MTVDAIGAAVAVTCWTIFAVLPLGLLIYLLFPRTEKKEDEEPKWYNLAEEEMKDRLEEKKEVSE